MNTIKIRDSFVNVEIAKTFFEKFRGLMFSPPKNILFVFEKESFYPIHSLFVFYPFKALYLNEDFVVVEMFEVKPFTFLVRNRKPARYLLELTDVVDVSVGDVIEWQGWDGKY